MFDEEFYPTPMAVAITMINRVSKEARYFLEPSAGKGDIAERIRGDSEYRRYNHHRSVDCIEQSPELVSVLTGKEFPVVGFDWLTYDGVCYYDAIVMNPPFSNGDAHLLKAWDFLHSGEIVCLLNSETINNPHTASRQRIAEIIKLHGDVEMLGDCFAKGERKTGVEVAMVYLKKLAADDAPDLWETSTAEKSANENDIASGNMLAIQDRLGNMQHYYDRANEHMLEGFRQIRKAAVYMAGNGIDGYKYEDIVKLRFKDFNEARAEFFRKHRRDAWMQVFKKMEFRKWLDKIQTDAFIRDIERNGNIPFTKDNIKGTLENVLSQRRKLFLQSCANVFDELRKYHADNVHHTEGWKSNSSYKINRKTVFPYGCNFSYGRFSLYASYSRIDIYNDLDRIMCVLDGKDFDACATIAKAMDNKFHILGYSVKSPFDNTTESRYFDIRFFKKGTVHLKFKDEKLLQDFN
jgi:hypothetical protein